MKTTHRLLLTAALTLPFAVACKKEEAAPAKAEAPAVPVPTTKDEGAWNTYLTDVVKRNADGALSVYAYTLPAADSPDFAGAYERQLGEAQTAMMRGGVEGTLLAFGSPDSAKSADLAVAALAKAAPDSMKGVRVLFIGDAADSARVEAAVKPTGATYKFVEAK
ncbi:hypothetical protein [Lysobacter sp. N42]|jgi:hypothetical protein|uniref:hypothetical protein n=1 Tax=Lysobacter sp. N42 TaxID=2545719 RepID=UPI00104E3C19|nr:hypothetical protein [Lysobacter sp. N42]TCZ88054.1 hypothetical protein EYQ95_14455 [Lysobacter sp. N42]